MHADDTRFHLLRVPGEKPPNGQPVTVAVDKPEHKVSGPGEYILCGRCSQVITTSDERISVDGSHRHTFANPHGMVFDIGCFRTASGCGYAGSPSDEFTWFKGYSWRIAVCGMCLTHLGWLFMSGSGDNFHGFILDRIIDSSNSE